MAINKRTLTFETLEGRQMMAVFTVTNLNDAVVTAAGQAPGTLRQAIFDANATPAVADVIQFAGGLSGTIQLTNAGSQVEGPSALVISSAITIRGNTNGITIARAAAAPEMRIFRVATTGNLTLESLNVTGGIARGAAGTSGENGGDGLGGAVFNAGTLQVVASTLYDNTAIGGAPGGGGVTGRGAGGAVYSADGTLNVRNATLSANRALNSSENTLGSSFGGGIYALNGSLAIHNTTITNSSAAAGRGVYVVGIGDVAVAAIHSAIIGQADSSATVFEFFAGFEGGGSLHVTGANNLIRRQNDFMEITESNEDPVLSLLSSHGGPTKTHSPQVGSPALDSGSNLLNLTTDQRGAAFARMVGTGVDMGALEATFSAPGLPGDYNRDSFVGAADYVVWRKLLGSNVSTFALADGNGTGVVDPLDYDVWEENFGETPAGRSPTSNDSESVELAAVAGSRPSGDSLNALHLPSSEVAATPRKNTSPGAEELLLADAQDKALIALIGVWDGASRGGRDIDFE